MSTGLTDGPSLIDQSFDVNDIPAPDGGVDVSQIAAAGSPKKKRPTIIDPMDLLSKDTGISELYRSIASIPSHEDMKGHEMEFLRAILSRVETWGQNLNPKITPADFITKLEKRCRQREVRSHIEALKEDAPWLGEAHPGTISEQLIEKEPEVDVDALFGGAADDVDMGVDMNMVAGVGMPEKAPEPTPAPVMNDRPPSADIVDDGVPDDDEMAELLRMEME